MSSTNTAYLKELCHKYSAQKVEFRSSPLGGLGCFAVAPIPKGAVIFAIPRSLILSGTAPCVLLDPRVATLVKDPRITAESLLCAYMVWNRSSSSYLASLPTDYSQLIPSELEGTNVGAQLQADAQELALQQKIIQEILPDVALTVEDLALARALYNSRRYPLRFALTTHTSDKHNNEKGEAASDSNSPNKSQDNADAIVTDADSTTKNKKIKLQQQPTNRSVYDPTQGCLCPLLDLFNHQSGRDHLRFDVTSSTLHAISRYDIETGQEIYHNYDCATNDQWLLQFGFVETDNNSSSSEKDAEVDHDNHHKDDDGDVDVFTVQVGAQRFYLRTHQPIPDVLLGDGGYGLEQHLEAKQRAQASATSSHNPHVREYMTLQSRILTALLVKVQQSIRELEEEEQDGSHGEGKSGEDEDRPS